MGTPQREHEDVREIHRGGLEGRLERAMAEAAEAHEQTAKLLAENQALRAKITGAEAALAFYGDDGPVPATYAVALETPQRGRHQGVLATPRVAVVLRRDRGQHASAGRTWRQVLAVLRKHGAAQ